MVAPNNCGFPCADVCIGTAMVGVSENIVNIAQAAVNIASSLRVSIETEKTERP